MTINVVRNVITESIQVKGCMLENEALMQTIVDLADRCTKCLLENGKVIFCGNGGSFADAQHLSAEFTSRFLFDRPGLASIALGTNSSSMTAIGNDYGFENIFSREIEAIARPNDILIAITTSGNSVNILKAIEAAKTGYGQGQITEDIPTLNVPSADTARIQECHILIGHLVCQIVEENIYKDLKR